MERKGNKETHPPLLWLEPAPLIYGQEHYLYNVSENRWDTKMIPSLFDSRPIPCNYGWVALNNPFTNNSSLWNPKSTEIIQLPDLRESCMYSQCVLSKPPTESGCHILFKSAGMFNLAFCQIGDDQFVEMSTRDIKDVQWVETLKFFHGDIYALVGSEKTLGTISFVDKTLHFRPILSIYPSLRRRPWSNNENYYLIHDDDDDEMLLVCKMSPASYLHQFSDFKIFRIDINKLECVELLDIGQRAIFLSHTGNTFCCSSTGINPNSIYYTFAGRNAFAYNLDNRATTSLLPCLAAHRFATTFWIEHNFL